MTGSASESSKGTTGPATWSNSESTQKTWKGPAWPQLGGPRSPRAPTRHPALFPAHSHRRHGQVLVLGCFLWGVFADKRLPWVSFSSLAQPVDEPGNLRGVFVINKCKHLNLNSSSWSCPGTAPGGEERCSAAGRELQGWEWEGAKQHHREGCGERRGRGIWEFTLPSSLSLSTQTLPACPGS